MRPAVEGRNIEAGRAAQDEGLSLAAPSIHRRARQDIGDFTAAERAREGNSCELGWMPPTSVISRDRSSCLRAHAPRVPPRSIRAASRTNCARSGRDWPPPRVLSLPLPYAYASRVG